MVNGLATDASIVATISAAIPAPYGEAILSMLSDPTETARLAALVGSVVTGFVGQNGVVDALSAAATQVASAALAGTPLPAALQSVLGSLQSVPAIASALDNTISTALSAILGDRAVQAVVNTITQGAIDTLINGTPDNPSVVPPVVGEAIVAAVDSLVANPVVQELIGEIAGSVVTGTPVAELAPTLIESVISQPALQIALGAAVGQGIGALFGENPVGFVVARAAAVAATIAIGMAAGLAGLINLFNPGFIASLGGFASPAAAVSVTDHRTSALTTVYLTVA